MKKGLLLSGIAALICTAAGAGLVYASDHVQTVNRFHTGVVDIELEETVTNTSLLPSEETNMQYIIRALGEDCYIRVRSSTFTNDSFQENFGTALNEDGWYAASDGCVYLIEPLKSGESVCFDTAIRIAEKLGQEEYFVNTAGLQAEAIQADWFTPDYESESPWGDVQIKELVSRGMMNNADQETASDFSLRYVNGLKLSHSDLFANLGTLMPGSSLTDSLEIRNDDTEERTIRFRVDRSEGIQALLKHMTITLTLINVNETQIYSGSPAAEAMKQGIDLVTLAPGESAEFRFCLEMDKEADNELVEKEGRVCWSFLTDNEDLPPEIPEDPDEPETPDEQESPEVVITGDDRLIGPWEAGLLLVITGGLFGLETLIALVWLWKRERERR